jgi:hypothetical protein
LAGAGDEEEDADEADFVVHELDAGVEVGQRLARESGHSQPASDVAQPARPPGTTSRGTIIRQTLPDTGDAGDSGDVRPLDVSEWTDPANQQMLGRRAWMATPSSEHSEAIDEAFEEAAEHNQKQHYPIALPERRLGVELAKDIVNNCFERLLERVPHASGRISVAFDLVADGGQARFSKVEIPAKVHLDDPGFEACITTELSAASFRSAEQGTMHVEYPFLFD